MLLKMSMLIWRIMFAFSCWLCVDPASCDVRLLAHCSLSWHHLPRRPGQRQAITFCGRGLPLLSRRSLLARVEVGPLLSALVSVGHLPPPPTDAQRALLAHGSLAFFLLLGGEVIPNDDLLLEAAQAHRRLRLTCDCRTAAIVGLLE